MEKQIEITCFAGLQKFFSRKMRLEMEIPIQYQNIINKMKTINPEANEILDSCRIAEDERFVATGAMKTTDGPVFLIPPSSGG